MQEYKTRDEDNGQITDGKTSNERHIIESDGCSIVYRTNWARLIQKINKDTES